MPIQIAIIHKFKFIPNGINENLNPQDIISVQIILHYSLIKFQILVNMNSFKFCYMFIHAKIQFIFTHNHTPLSLLSVLVLVLEHNLSSQEG